MGIAPWEVMDRPQMWIEWALVAESAEAGAMNSVQTTEENLSG